MKSSHGKYDSFVTTEAFIGDLKQNRDEAWAVFYDNYASMIMNFALKRGCSSQLAEDVLQETVMAVFRHIERFQYDRKKGRFRSFLFRITESKVVDAFRKMKPHSSLDDEKVLFKFEKSSASSDDAEKAIKIWDQVWDKHILSQAMDEAKGKVQPMTFKCFEEVYLKDRAVKDVAEELDISPNLVSQHKHKVMNLVVKAAKDLKEFYGE